VRYQGTIPQSRSQWRPAATGLSIPLLRRRHRRRFIQSIRRNRVFSKPLFVAETGSATYEGCGEWGGDAYAHYTNQTYSQEEQAELIRKSMELIMKSDADAVFLNGFLDKKTLDHQSYGIVKFERRTPDQASFSIMRHERATLFRRKLGFYAYQSFVVAT